MISGFDYSRYLREKRICGIVKVNEVRIISKEKDFKFYLFKVKEMLCKNLDKTYSEKESGFLKAILLGNTSNLDDETKENFRNASVSHVLAISGMHISYIVLVLENILKKFIKNIKIRYAFIIIFLFVFAIFVGESNSVMRACIMTIIVYFGKIILRKDNFFASFKFALCFLLIVNPYNIFSGSMWLSFGGSLGIVLYSKFIEKTILRKVKKVQKIVSIMSVTFGAQIIVFPIMIYIFNTFSLNFIISNLLISELISPILILGYISLIVPFVSVIEKIFIKVIFLITKIIGIFPLNQILIPTPKLYKLIIYYCILGVVAFVYNNRKLWIIRNLRKIGKLKIVLLITIILLLLFGNINIPFRDNFEIHFLDVGQGDCCLIRTKSNKTILIDAGKGIDNEYDYGKNVVGPYLLDHGITKLDYVIVSHFDSDHCGGLFYILENFKVKNIVIGKQYDRYTNLMKFLSLPQVKKTNLIAVEAEAVLMFDKYTQAEILFPNSKNKISENEINNNSLVFKLYYKNISLLFTGDIEEEAEKVLVALYGEKLKSDILKVGHHGSKTSSTEDFIEKVKPKIALIGVGKNNTFGHPNEEVLNRLKSIGCKTYRTDEIGEVSIFI